MSAGLSRVSPVQLTRRSLLTGGALGLAAACRRTAPPASPDPDVPLRAAALQREQELLAAYQAVIASRPALAAHLQPLAADQTAHVVALGTSPSPTPAASTVSTVAQLKVLERQAAAAHTAAALTASRSLAPELASLAAASSSALAVL